MLVSSSQPNTMILAILLCSLPYFATLWYAVRMGRIWLNPITFITIYYFFNYPVRATLLTYFPEGFNSLGFDDQTILAGLLYSSTYFLVFSVVYFGVLKGRISTFEAARLKSLVPNTQMLLVLASVVLAAGLVVLVYEVSVGGAFSLGQSLEDLRRPVWVNVAGVFYAAKWLLLCLAILLFLRNRTLVPLLIAGATLTLLLAEGLFSTGKGFIATLVLLYLFLDNYQTGRAYRVSVITAGIVALVLFSSYSYYARYYIGFGQDATSALGEFVAYLTDTDLSGNLLDQMEAIINRGTYYLDGLLVMIRDGTTVDPGPYWMGSVVELLNIIPRATGLIEEQYSFDRHVTNAVWGSWVFAQVFIGRIGESYFVMGPIGVVYGVINGLIFATVALLWQRAKLTIVGIALYFAALVSWLYQDASLTFQVKSLSYILVTWLVCSGIARFLTPPKRSADHQVLFQDRT